MTDTITGEADPATVRLTRREVAELMGWTSSNSIDVALYRTRNGTSRTAFPLPGEDGRWDRAEVERYRDERGSRGRRNLTQEQIRRVRKLSQDGKTGGQIQQVTGVPAYTVYRLQREMGLR